MTGNGVKEKCIHDGKEMLQHVGKTVTTLSYRPRYSRCVKNQKKIHINLQYIFVIYIRDKIFNH